MEVVEKKELEAIVGKEYVLEGPELVEKYSKDYSLVSGRSPAYVVQPKNKEEIQEIIKLANRYKFPVVPRSSEIGFFGAGIPDQGGIVLSLKRMNRILEVDPRNRKVRIEPGVTWAQLQDELKNHGLRALNPLFPHREKSVLTSHLEREPMLITKAEYSEPIYTLEVVLPNGDLFRTGAASVGEPSETQVDNISQWGPGADFLRLFKGAQGTLGIVTWIAIKAEPLPKAQKVFFMPFECIEDMVETIYGIQRKMLGYECFALNNLHLANIISRKEDRNSIGLSKELPPWTLVLSIAATGRLPQEKIQYETEDLMELTQSLGIEPRLNLPGSNGREKIIIEGLYQAWSQEPYWKLRCKGGCHDIFFHTTLDRVPEFTEAFQGLAAKLRYPTENIGSYIQPIEYGRVCHCEFGLSYDPRDSRDVERVKDLYREACKLFIDMGAVFTRPYGPLAKMVFSRDAALSMIFKKVKDMVDPNDIMNPGKLGI